jgi:hypothetical protein
MATVCNLNFYLPSCYTLNATYPGQADGTVQVTALDGSSVATVRYNLNTDFTYPSGGQTSGNFANLVPGTYTIYARNSTTCRAVITLVVGFDTAYRVRERLDFNDLKSTGVFGENRKWRLDIEDNQYVFDTVNELEGSSEDPVILAWRGEGSEDLFDTNVIGSELTVKINSRTDQEYIYMYTYDETRFRASLYQYSGGSYQLFWRGFLVPMLYSEPYTSKTNYEVNLIFTDRLADLSQIAFSDDGDNLPTTRIPVMNAISYIINKTDVPLNIWETVNFYATGMDSGVDDSTLEQMRIDTSIYLEDDGTAKDCLTVLKAIMDMLCSRIYQSNGRWNIDLITEKSASSVPTRKRTETLTVLTGDDESPRILLRRKNQPTPKVNFAEMSQMLSIPQTYGTVNVTFDMGIKNNLLANGKFEIEDIANGQFIGWQADLSDAPNATIGLERLKEPRNGSEYAFYAQFDTTIDEEFLTIESLPVPLAAVAGDYTLKINFDVYARPVFTDTYIYFDVAVKIGTTYLKPVRGLAASNEFSSGSGPLLRGEFKRFYIENPLTWQSFSIDAFVNAADAISGDMVLIFYFSSNPVFDLDSFAALKASNPNWPVYDKRRRVKENIYGEDLLYYYELEFNNSVTEISPDIFTITGTDNVWRLKKTSALPEDTDGNLYGSWLHSVLLDNVTVQYFPLQTVPQEEEVITEYPNVGVRQVYDKTILHSSLPTGLDENYALIAKGLLFDADDEVITASFKRRGVSEDRTHTELVARMMRGQYQELRWKLTGQLDLPDTIITFYNTLHETRTGKIYQFMALTLYLRSQLADMEALETLSGGAIVDETGDNIVNPEDIPGFEPPVAARLVAQTGFFRLTGYDVDRKNYLVAETGYFTLTGYDLSFPEEVWAYFTTTGTSANRGAVIFFARTDYYTPNTPASLTAANCLNTGHLGTTPAISVTVDFWKDNTAFGDTIDDGGGNIRAADGNKTIIINDGSLPLAYNGSTGAWERTSGWFTLSEGADIACFKITAISPDPFVNGRTFNFNLPPSNKYTRLAAKPTFSAGATSAVFFDL